MLRRRASIVLEKDGKILLIRRENEKGLYYVFPGGGIEGNETVEDAVVREMKEEAGILLKPGDVLLQSVNDFDDNTLMLCTQVDEKKPLWQETYKQAPGNTYEFTWVEIDSLADLELLPKEGRDAVIHHFTTGS